VDRIKEDKDVAPVRDRVDFQQVLAEPEAKVSAGKTPQYKTSPDKP
jgi:hypothetical protein